MIAIMSKDGQSHLLAPGQCEQFAGAGAEHLLIHVRGSGFSLGSEGSLYGDRVDGEEHGTGFGKTHQNRLVAWHMPAGFNQIQSWEQLGITVEQAVTQRGMILLVTGASKTWAIRVHMMILSSKANMCDVTSCLHANQLKSKKIAFSSLLTHSQETLHEPTD